LLKIIQKISSDALPIPAAAQQAPAAPANEVPVSECTRRAEPTAPAASDVPVAPEQNK